MELTEGQLKVMESESNLLVTGGPGSGKTTISILKAAQVVESHLSQGQKILFLSFARATVSRVVEAIEHEQEIDNDTKKRIDVDTYHAFFWRVLKTHGYLVGLPRRLWLLTPASEAIALSTIRSKFPVRKLTDAQRTERANAVNEEKLRLAREEGKICFDLFAPYVAEIVIGSSRVRRLIATKYPVIILDEFQDTNLSQWQVVEALGEFSRLIALADPEQRIYDWIGADPERLNHFRASFAPDEVDLSTDNHRSAGTDIARFGNDILSGKFKQGTYVGIAVDTFEPFQDPAMTKLITTTYAARTRLIDQGIKQWSLAILVPTKKMTRVVSDSFRSPPAGMAEIYHTATIDMEAAVLGAELIAHLMQPSIAQSHFADFVQLLCNYFQGKDGDEPTQSALKEAASLKKAYDELVEAQAKGKALRKSSILHGVLGVYAKACALEMTGDPDTDWKSVRSVLEKGECKRLKEVAEEVRNVRLLDRGSQLRQQLSQDWRDARYGNALEITRQAFVQEHFSISAKPESGVVVMNMHKAKGKQFDEVIVFEGWPIKSKGQIVANLDRIVRSNLKELINDQARQNFRVSVTRGKRQTTILTPKGNPCVLLLPV